jgi:hypothetical protein
LAGELHHCHVAIARSRQSRSNAVARRAKNVVDEPPEDYGARLVPKDCGCETIAHLERLFARDAEINEGQAIDSRLPAARVRCAQNYHRTIRISSNRFDVHRGVRPKVDTCIARVVRDRRDK